MAEYKRTEEQFGNIIAECRLLFTQKFKDYGASWRVMRPTAITDQISIKAKRIRSVQVKGENKVGESLKNEFIAIVNYAIMGMVQLEKGYTDAPEEEKEVLLSWYDEYAERSKQLMFSKNHDYGEAWRSMRISSITDIILQKIFRTKQIEDNQGSTKVSEGIDANYLDMLNYAIFALIKISEGEDAME
ncbi:MAG: DUF1599 domain-containing protein [Bacteroidales bacterium]|uniref:DUF1599 domain-containing protein n=1 Tax=Porphyromonas sp. TaxID=1924944 RepID=UPI002976F601|nr:DUF1599 domain-containing protein [Porphyromonas sp.]MDD7438097.1 DUF1599 domain-containing protein [Bacteroidales bacterium]MDY3067064.1 DUF1599 domain-containing protein [Porphyromonas sp.]